MTRTQNPNLEIIEIAARALGPLCDELVFLGGCATALLITDSAAPPVRITRQVLRVQAAGNYLELHTAYECHLIRTTLSALASRLGGSGFVRVHRSTLVNRRHVSRLDRDPKGEWQLRMMDGTVVRVGRRYRSAVERMIHPQADELVS